MKPLKIGIGGVRGVVGETFTPELAVAFAQAFGTYLGPGTILVGRDTRASGPMVAAAVRAGLLATGCAVIDVGRLSDAQPAARGAVARGARRHLHHGGSQRRRVERAQVRQAGRALPECAAGRGTAGRLPPGRVREGPLATAFTTVDRRRRTPSPIISRCSRRAFDRRAIRRRRPRVALDCCNGACVRLTPRWLESIGCEVLAINDDGACAVSAQP